MRDTGDLKYENQANSGISLTEQKPVNATITVELDGSPPSDVWNDLSSSEAFQGELVKAVLDAGRKRTYLEYHDLLDQADIDAQHGSFRSLVLGVAQGDESALWSLLRETRQLGTGHSTIDDAVDVARLFRLALENQPDRDTPTVTFTMKPEFREQRANQRRELCAVLAELSRGCNVHLVGSGLSRRWLIDTHRTDLPVSSECNTPQKDSPLSELVDEALGELDSDGREAMILHQLSEESTETLSYHSVYSTFHVDKSRIRQCVSQLVDLGLVNTFGPNGDRMVELLEAGREYLSEVTQQITLNESVSGSGNTHLQTTCNPSFGIGGEDGQVYQTTVQSRPNKTAANACSLDNDVSIVNEPVELDQTEQERKDKAVYYDEDRDVATVSVRAGEGLPYLVSVATALATPWFIDRTLPNSRLEAIDEPATILREGRNIGGLSDRALNDPEELRSVLVEWGEELESLTTELNHATGDDAKALASEIMRSSHGLAGSIVHLLDAAGIDVVREIRVPGGRGLNKLENLSESIARSILIQSKYGVFAPYRHILETDAGRPLISPEVDAADPCGSLIGSFVIRGKDTHRLRPLLETALSSPGEFVDELPEFTIPISVRNADRPEFGVTVTRMLKSKNIKPTREAVSLVHALTESPYDAARALNQLGKEDSVRDVRPDEIRYALSTLEVERILPDHSPTVGKVVHTLLQATEPLSQTALAEVADVSERSIRNNRDALEALGVVSIDARGYRLNLSFRTTEERRNPVMPNLVDSTFTEAVDALFTEILPPARYGDPEDPIGGALFWPPDPWVLLDNPDLAPWVKLAARLTGTENPENETTISVGPAIEQTPIVEPTEVVA